MDVLLRQWVVCVGLWPPWVLSWHTQVWPFLPFPLSSPPHYYSCPSSSRMPDWQSGGRRGAASWLTEGRPIHPSTVLGWVVVCSCLRSEKCTWIYICLARQQVSPRFVVIEVMGLSRRGNANRERQSRVLLCAQVDPIKPIRAAGFFRNAV